MILRKRFFLIFILIFSFLLSISISYTIAEEEKLRDAQNADEYYDEIKFLIEKGIIQGDKDGNFRPDAVMTRGEFIKIVLVADNIEITSDCKNSKQAFHDVPAHSWQTPYLCEAKLRNMIQGYKDGTFRSYLPISLSRAAKLLGITFFEMENNVRSEDWAKPYLEKLAENKVLLPELGGARSHFTRAEAAEIFYRILAKDTSRNSLSYEELEQKENGFCSAQQNVKVGDKWTENEKRCTCTGEGRMYCTQEIACNEARIIIQSTETYFMAKQIIYMKNNMLLGEENGEHIYTGYFDFQCKNGIASAKYDGGDAGYRFFGEIFFNGESSWEKECSMENGEYISEECKALAERYNEL